jgi:cytochrome c biogenesis protein ResB
MNFSQRIKKLLLSPKTVVSLIIITLIACLIGFLVPQIADKSPSFFEQWKEQNIYTYRFVTRLQLHQVYTSYWFLVLVVLIAVSLAYSLFSQVKKNLHYNRMDRPQNAGHQSQSLEKVRNVLRRRRFREQGFLMAEHKLIFTKNSFIAYSGNIRNHDSMFPEAWVCPAYRGGYL